MTTPPSLGHPFVLDRADLAEADAETVLGGAGYARADGTAAVPRMASPVRGSRYLAACREVVH